MQKHKPLGIVLISIYSAFWGVVMLPVGCMSSMAAGVPGVPSYAGPLGFLSLAFGVAMMAATYGLWTIQPWGRNFSIWLELATIPFNLMTLVGFSPDGKVTEWDRITAIISIVLTAVIVRYLASEGMKRMYDQNTMDVWRSVEPKL